MNEILRINHLSKKFKKRNVLRDISFTVYEGEIVGFVGPNGAGKTTTINLCTGLYSFNEGKIQINNFDLNIQYEQALKDCGIIYDESIFYEYLSGWDNLKLYAKIKNSYNIENIDQLVKMMGLKNHINDKVKTYSFGMKKRLDLIKVLIGNPKIIIMDEPFNGLDPQGIIEFREILKQISENGTSILISSHLLSELTNFCNRIIAIKNGQIIGDEKVDTQMIILELGVNNLDVAINILKQFGYNILSKNYNKIKIMIKNTEISNINNILLNSSIEIQYFNIVNSLEYLYTKLMRGDIIEQA